MSKKRLPKPAWYDREDFWEVMAPKLFTGRHWLKAPVELDFILSRLDLAPGSYVLDLCCGPGRHSLELARRGFNVTGVDRTQRYLDEAKSRAEAEGLSIEFVKADMRDFRRSGAFDAVLSMYSSFGFFEKPGEDRRVLKNIYASLKPGGRLFMDMMGKEVVACIFTERDWHEEDGVLYLEERELSDDWGSIKNRWIMIHGRERAEFTFSLRLYSGVELSSLLTSCGFSSVKLFGDFSGAPYNQAAERLLALAVK